MPGLPFDGSPLPARGSPPRAPVVPMDLEEGEIPPVVPDPPPPAAGAAANGALGNVAGVDSGNAVGGDPNDGSIGGSDLPDAEDLATRG